MQGQYFISLVEAIKKVYIIRYAKNIYQQSKIGPLHNLQAVLRKVETSRQSAEGGLMGKVLHGVRGFFSLRHLSSWTLLSSGRKTWKISSKGRGAQEGTQFLFCLKIYSYK